MTNRSRNLLVGVVAILALAPSMHGQNRNPVGGRPKPQKPLDVPPAVVVLQVDTSEGDSTRTIIQRDFDYGDRIQPLILDSVTLGDIWRPGEKRINFSPLAQTRATFLVRARPTTAGLHVEVYDVPQGRLRQEDYFRLPKRPPNRLPAIRDSLSGVLDEKAQATNEARAANAAMRDSIAREAAKPLPLKTTRDRANARRAQAARDSLERERRLGIHVVADEVERWITGTRGISATRIAFVEGTKLKVVDSDGANERTIPTAGAALSPSWHPSGRYIVYVDADDRGTRIAQVDLRTMRPRLLSASNRGLNITP